MGTYKVIQDIEAEDKLLGPLTLKQFIYAIIVIVSCFAAFQLATVSMFLATPLLPFILFFSLLAAPIGGAQSSEVWLLAKIRFFLKPRKRVWDQVGIKELVTITAPKKIEKILTDGLNQNEVKSRLGALANTLDSRGWATKNVNVNLYTQPGYAYAASDQSSDRLIDPAAYFPQEVPNYDVTNTEDMFDALNNPRAQQLSTMINSSTEQHKQQLIQTMQNPQAQPTPPQDYWFMNRPDPNTIQPGQAVFDNTQVIRPYQAQPTAQQPRQTSTAAPDEQTILDQLHANAAQPVSYGHMRVIKPISDQPDPQQTPTAPVNSPPAQAVTADPDPAILELATNDDLDVATIARQAEKKRKPEPPADEVVISLH